MSLADSGHKAIYGKPFRSLLRYNLPYWRAYGAGMLLSIVFMFVALASPMVVRAVVMGFENGTLASRDLGLAFGVLIVAAVATGLGRYWERMLIIRASRRFEYDLRNDYFQHVQRLSRDFFHRTKTGDIMARITNDLNFVRMFVGPGVMGTFDMVRLPYALALMFYLNVKLTLISLMILPVVSTIMYFFIMLMHRQSQVVQAHFSTLTARAQENLAGARVVKAYAVADREQAAFYAESKRYMRENVKLGFIMNFLWPTLSLLLGLTIILAIWRGGIMVIEGASTTRPVLQESGLALQSVRFRLGDLTGFVLLLLMLSWPLTEFGWVVTLYQRGAVGMNRISEILKETPAVDDGPNTRADTQIPKGGFTFNNVSFSYGATPVLHNVSFEVQPGQTLAIVGPTGSGKSTLVSLLMREYDPREGEVCIDGIDLRQIPLQRLRESIGFAPQDLFLFSDSIRANLTIGKPHANGEQMDFAAEAAQFTETLSRLEQGYETLLGERGVNLSGGQKQRLTLARAIIQDPKILVLDDTLSSVDTHTEEQILERLIEVTSDRTTVLIAHRISTIKHADIILTLDDGRIVERGSHSQLVEAGGLYARMYSRQLLEEELEVQ